MMDKKRIRQTLNDFVERYLLGDVDGDSFTVEFCIQH